MPKLIVEARRLTKPGLIRGGRGHKQEVIPLGTTVYIIKFMEAHRYYRGIYLTSEFANWVTETLKQNHPKIFEPEMWDWNFTRIPPHHVDKPIITRDLRKA